MKDWIKHSWILREAWRVYHLKQRHSFLQNNVRRQSQLENGRLNNFLPGFPISDLKKNWRFYAFVVNWLALLLLSSKNQYVIGIASVVTCNVQHWVILTAFRELKSGTFYMTGDLSARLEISVPQWYKEFASRERKKALANVPAILTQKYAFVLQRNFENWTKFYAAGAQSLICSHNFYFLHILSCYQYKDVDMIIELYV